MGNFFVNWLAATPVEATPLLLATLGLIVSERAGVLTLAAEGYMLCGAVAGVGAYLTLNGDPFVALIAAMLAAATVSLLFSLLTLALRIDQVITGLATVFLCDGLTNLVGSSMGWTNRPISGLATLALGPLSHLPVLGRILFAQDAVVYVALLLVVAVNWGLFGNLRGLRLRAVGENPEAADAAGVSVLRARFLAVTAGAALIGLAGGYLALGSAKLWIAGMTGGRGWIAVALVIFSRWQPWRALSGALLFGCIGALIPRVNASAVAMPQYFLLMTPYLATLAVMTYVCIVKGGTSGAPAALGAPFVREERH